MLRVLTDDEIARVLDLDALLDVVEDGLIAQYRGHVERPPRPHFSLGAGIESADPLGTGLAMPAYVHGSAFFATKVVSIFERNRERGLPTIHGAIYLADATTGQARGLLDGTRITNARTGCVGGVSARALVDGPVTLGILGAGQQARWQARAIGAACEVDDIRIYAPSESRVGCADDLSADGFDARAVESAVAAVEEANVIVTATTSEEPVFPAEALGDVDLVLAIGAFEEGMQEIEAAVVEQADQVFADVPEEVVEIGDIQHADIDAADLLPLGGLLAGAIDPVRGNGYVLVESVGSAVFDAVASEHVFERAASVEIGHELPFH